MNAAKAGMLCPICRVDLVMSDRQGIEIDYCPQCRGVWLDRGELDKIIDRSAPHEARSEPPRPAAPPQPAYQPQAHQPQHPSHPHHEPYRPQGYGYGHEGQDPRHRDYGDYHKRKRKSFLGDLFDFD